MNNLELAEEIDLGKRNLPELNVHERLQIIAALRRGPLLCSRCLIQVESHGELYERPPSGEMVMVPREPTDAMRAAGYQQYVSADKRGYSAWQDHLAVYRAMLSAAEAEGRKG